MKKHIIGITQRLATQESYQERREILASDWGEFCKTMQVLPIPLSYAINIQEYSSLINGVILSGGNDLSIFSDEKNSIMRDGYEKEVIEYCIKHQLPLLGVCRGAQMIASYFESNFMEVGNHIGEHQIVWSDGERDCVNSYHHYAITSLGDELRCEARSEDRWIESFSHKTLPIFAIMWHPEREGVQTFSTQRIFEKFLGSLK